MILNYYNDMDSCKTYIRVINNSIDPRYKTKKINPGRSVSCLDFIRESYGKKS